MSSGYGLSLRSKRNAHRSASGMTMKGKEDSVGIAQSKFVGYFELNVVEMEKVRRGEGDVIFYICSLYE